MAGLSRNPKKVKKTVDKPSQNDIPSDSEETQDEEMDAEMHKYFVQFLHMCVQIVSF